jgi:predicted PurR-regulated permease PerM
LKAVAEYLFQHLSAITQNAILLIIEFAIMVYSLFYFIRDREKLIKAAARYTPVNNNHLTAFVHNFLNTAKATLKTTFVIGGIQGFLGGLIFYIAGIERALVWGVLMVGFSVVPAIGCSLIWVPAGIIMLFLGHTWQGITILVFGALVISSVDNLLRPLLLGRDIEMHSLLIFLSTLGGIAVFGFSGFVLGPVITSLFLASWKLFLELYQKEDVKK